MFLKELLLGFVIGDDFVMLGGGCVLRFIVCEAAEPPSSSDYSVGDDSLRSIKSFIGRNCQV